MDKLFERLAKLVGRSMASRWMRIMADKKRLPQEDLRRRPRKPSAPSRARDAS
jgi:hypothetical protein